MPKTCPYLLSCCKLNWSVALSYQFWPVAGEPDVLRVLVELSGGVLCGSVVVRGKLELEPAGQLQGERQPQDEKDVFDRLEPGGKCQKLDNFVNKNPLGKTLYLWLSGWQIALYLSAEIATTMKMVTVWMLALMGWRKWGKVKRYLKKRQGTWNNGVGPLLSQNEWNSYRLQALHKGTSLSLSSQLDKSYTTKKGQYWYFTRAVPARAASLPRTSRLWSRVWGGCRTRSGWWGACWSSCWTWWWRGRRWWRRFRPDRPFPGWWFRCPWSRTWSRGWTLSIRWRSRSSCSQWDEKMMKMMKMNPRKSCPKGSSSMLSPDLSGR